MVDTRVRVALKGKKIDLAQLAAEVGVPLSASAEEVVVADERSKLTSAELEMAVKVHAPKIKTVVPPLTDTEVLALRALITPTPKAV